MTWPDILFLFVMVVAISLGSRVGSMWSAGCLLAGVAGAFLADTYTIALTGTLSSFLGARALAGLFLFLVGVVLVMGPILLFYRFFEDSVVLTISDGAFGLASGMAITILMTMIFLLFAVPMSPKFQTSDSWSQSHFVKPLHDRLEIFFQNPRFRTSLSGLGAAGMGIRELEPLKDKAEDKIKAAVKKVRA